MYRVADGERRVFLLNDRESDDDANIFQQEPLAYSQPQHSYANNVLSKNSSSISFMEKCPPDIVLHSDGCAIAVHLPIIQQRCPFLYKQLRQLRHLSEVKQGSITLKVLEVEDLRQLENDNLEGVAECPLHNPALLRLDYVRCNAHKYHSNAGRSQHDSPGISPRRKRMRPDVDEKQPSNGQGIVKSRRARSLFNDDIPTPLSPSSLETLELQRDVIHVKIEGTNIGAVVTGLEYIYRYKVRMIDEKNAMQAVRFGQWLHMRDTMLYYCLFIAIRHVTVETWMEMLYRVSTLHDKVMRQILCDRLLDFVEALTPEQYYDALVKMPYRYIHQLKHRDILVRAVAGLINRVRLLEFWRNLLDGLSEWLSIRFNIPHPPSLRALHHNFAPEWKPYMERVPVELEVTPGEGNLFTLLQFGKFQLQVRIDITAEMPILWRIIRSSSPQLLSSDPDKQYDSEAFKSDPEFWIRGQMKIKYQRAYPSRAQVSHEVVIQYQHCPKQYSTWYDLVPPSPSSLAPVTAAAMQPEGTGKVQFRGKFFVWGDPVCSLYHFLLHTTLFYAAPIESSAGMSDLMVVSEMQRLPVETLVLVLRSDRLRVPNGERTLLRLLNKLVFGNNFSYLGSSPNQETHKEYNGRAKDVIRLYKCIRWCFVPIDDILATLKRSPRELKFYELIEVGLQDTFRRFLRRRPWGWRKYRHPYLKNETNVVEFRIEAGENKLSPKYFSSALKREASSQDSVITRPEPVFFGTKE
ncbi:hypothetical protein P3T76_001451 [Phytophthora citrophthora]|uniref:BTB domain-containing protein n=1 Tax=Phytophthora citrophthora TaxID=4793 RepID=A0AAD9GZF7_9STRA|nr:hypothetical protein P3T76_001451 [Phytophthora citrophthora]